MKLAALLFCAAAAYAQSVVISQVYGGGGNAGSVWRNDFVELFNRGQSPVPLDGWTVQYASATGTAWQSMPLTGAMQPGQYYLIQLAAGAGGTQNLPAPDASGTLALGATAGKVRITAAERVIDLVGYGATANEAETAPVRDLSNTTAAIRANAGCTDTDNNAADFNTGAPAPRNSATARVNCEAGPPPAERLRISEIQGPGEVSPHEGKRVVTRGIVYARRSNGFYIQSVPADRDDDDRTSEGLLISTPVAATVGTLVDVTGTVTEFRPPSDSRSAPLTELTNVTVEVLAQNQTLPEPLTLSGFDWERHEGMRVQLPSATVCGPSIGATFFVSVSTARPFRRPGLNGDDPAVVRVITPSVAMLRVGQRVAGLRGPLDFGQRRYTILTEGPIATTLEALLPPPPVPAPAAGEFTIASLNLLRLFSTSSDFETRIGRLRTYIQQQLRSPDILAVQEAGTAAALERLASELGGYRALHGATNDPSGIAPGYLVKSSVVLTTAFPIDNPIHDRQPYRLNVRVGGRDLAVLNLHMRSLTDVEDPAVQAKRRAQAENVNLILRGMMAESIPFVVTGDFNALPFDDGYGDLIGVMTQGLNLLNVNPRLKSGDNYSYVFSGQTQALDHMLVSPRVTVTRVAYGQGNADLPDTERASDHDAIVGYFSFASPSFTPFSITSAATYQTGSIAPGEIVTIFGSGLTAAQFTVDGRPARTLYSSPTQWTVLIPNELPMGTTARIGHGSTTVEVPVSFSAPALFDTRPVAAPGQAIELWGTGGATNVAARACGLPAEVLYSGIRDGLWQINVKVPEQCPTGDTTVEVSSGTRTSNAIGLKLQAQ